MTQNATISLVVPFYNNAQLFSTTLDSILAQSVLETLVKGALEVILVDDGSTDGTAALAAAFAEANPFARVITQSNSGVGAARNAGLDAANGKYITFLDAEDLLPPTALERMLTAIKRSGADLVVGGMSTFPKRTRWTWAPDLAEGERVLSSVAEAPRLLQNRSVCNKLFRTARLREGSRFPEDVAFEDAYVSLPQLLRASAIHLVPDVVYIHRTPVRHVAGDAHLVPASGYFDVLTMIEAVRRAVPGLDPERAGALAQVELQQSREYVHFAHRYLDETTLRTFFDRATQIFAELEPATVDRDWIALNFRISFASVALRNWASFISPDHSVKSLSVKKNGGIYADIPGLEVEHWKQILRLAGISARADGLTAAPGENARFQIRMTTDGLDVTEQLMRLTPKIMAGKGTKKVALEPVPESRQSSDAGVVRFEAEAPVRQWPQGTWPLEVSLMSPTSKNQRVIPVASTIGMDMSSRSFRQDDIIFQAVVGEQRRLLIRIRKGKNVAAKWMVRSVGSDLVNFVRRRPFSGWKLLRLITMPFFRHRTITLICERTDTAQDNGFHLFRAMRTAEKPADAYYVIAASSPQRSRVTPFGNVLDYDSFRHKLYLLHARTLVSSNSINSYLIPRSWNLGAYRSHFAYRLAHRRVYLRHGVSLADIGWIHDRSRSGLDVILSTNERERADVEKTTGYGRETALTGLPRFDALVRGEDQRQVLVMPTWRRWLVAASSSREAVDPGTFDGSEYQAFFDALLADERLIAALHQYDYTLKFYPHYGVASYFAGITGRDERVEVVTDLSQDLQETLKASSMMVTDFSSVAVDAGYLGIPIVYAQFDEEDFFEFHYKRGWMDYRKDGFGPVTTTLDQTVDAIIGYLATECAREPEYSDRIPAFFAHHDTNNTARVIERISAL